MKRAVSKISLEDQVKIDSKCLANPQNIYRSIMARSIGQNYPLQRRGINLPFFYPSFLPLNGIYALQRKATKKKEAVIYVSMPTSGSLPFLRPTLPHFKFQTKALGFGIKINPFQGFTFLEQNSSKLSKFKTEGKFETKFKQKYNNQIVLK